MAALDRADLLAGADAAAKPAATKALHELGERTVEYLRRVSSDLRVPFTADLSNGSRVTIKTEDFGGLQGSLSISFPASEGCVSGNAKGAHGSNRQMVRFFVRPDYGTVKAMCMHPGCRRWTDQVMIPPAVAADISERICEEAARRAAPTGTAASSVAGHEASVSIDDAVEPAVGDKRKRPADEATPPAAKRDFTVEAAFACGTRCGQTEEHDPAAFCAAVGYEFDDAVRVPRALPLGVSASEIPESELPFELTPRFLNGVRMLRVNSRYLQKDMFMPFLDAAPKVDGLPRLTILVRSGMDTGKSYVSRDLFNELQKRRGRVRPLRILFLSCRRALTVQSYTKLRKQGFAVSLYDERIVAFERVTDGSMPVDMTDELFGTGRCDESTSAESRKPLPAAESVPLPASEREPLPGAESAALPVSVAADASTGSVPVTGNAPRASIEVVQVESLFKYMPANTRLPRSDSGHFGASRPRFDVVVIDEAVAVMHQLTSKDTNKEQQLPNYSTFEFFVASATTVIALDAGFNDHAVATLLSVRPASRAIPACMLLNSYQLPADDRITVRMIRLAGCNDVAESDDSAVKPKRAAKSTAAEPKRAAKSAAAEPQRAATSTAAESRRAAKRAAAEPKRAAKGASAELLPEVSPEDDVPGDDAVTPEEDVVLPEDCETQPTPATRPKQGGANPVKLWILEVLRQVAAGSKVVVPSTHKHVLYALEQQIHDPTVQQALGLPALDLAKPWYLIYTQDNSKLAETRRQLADVDEVWGQSHIRLVMFSPTITNGLDCQTPFDSCIAYIATNTCGVRNAVQMLRRVRRLTSKCITIFDACGSACSLPAPTVDSVLARMARRHEGLSTEVLMAGTHMGDSGLNRLNQAFVDVEKSMDTHAPRWLLCRLLNSSGFRVVMEVAEDDGSAARLIKSIEDESTELPLFADIRELTEAEANDIGARVRSGLHEVAAADQLALAAYNALNPLALGTPREVACTVWDNVLRKPKLRSTLRNLRCLYEPGLSSTTRDVAYNLAYCLPRRAQQHLLVGPVLEVLNFEDVCESKRWTSDEQLRRTDGKSLIDKLRELAARAEIITNKAQSWAATLSDNEQMKEAGRLLRDLLGPLGFVVDRPPVGRPSARKDGVKMNETRVRDLVVGLHPDVAACIPHMREADPYEEAADAVLDTLLSQQSVVCDMTAAPARRVHRSDTLRRFIGDDRFLSLHGPRHALAALASLGETPQLRARERSAAAWTGKEEEWQPTVEQAAIARQLLERSAERDGPAEAAVRPLCRLVCACRWVAERAVTDACAPAVAMRHAVNATAATANAAAYEGRCAATAAAKVAAAAAAADASADTAKASAVEAEEAARLAEAAALAATAASASAAEAAASCTSDAMDQMESALALAEDERAKAVVAAAKAAAAARAAGVTRAPAAVDSVEADKEGVVSAAEPFAGSTDGRAVTWLFEESSWESAIGVAKETALGLARDEEELARYCEGRTADDASVVQKEFLASRVQWQRDKLKQLEGWVQARVCHNQVWTRCDGLWSSSLKMLATLNTVTEKAAARRALDSLLEQVRQLDDAVTAVPHERPEKVSSLWTQEQWTALIGQRSIQVAELLTAVEAQRVAFAESMETRLSHRLGQHIHQHALQATEPRECSGYCTREKLCSSCVRRQLCGGCAQCPSCLAPFVRRLFEVLRAWDTSCSASSSIIKEQWREWWPADFADSTSATRPRNMAGWRPSNIPYKAAAPPRFLSAAPTSGSDGGLSEPLAVRLEQIHRARTRVQRRLAAARAYPPVAVAAVQLARRRMWLAQAEQAKMDAEAEEAEQKRQERRREAVAKSMGRLFDMSVTEPSDF